MGEKMSEIKPTKRARTPFLVSLVGGILIILGGLYTAVRRLLRTGGTYRGTRPGMGGIGNATRSAIGGTGSAMARPAYGAMGGTWILGIVFVSGIIVLISALMFNRRPAQATRWATLIVIFSIVSLFVGFMGVFFIARGLIILGAILGIIGGALPLLAKQKGSPALST